MGLPSGYRRLEYIQSSGTQWIDTGFKPNQDTRVVMNCYVISFNSCDMFLFGARVSAGNTAFYIAADDTNTKWFISYGNDVQNPVGTCTGHHSVDMNKNSVSIDGAITTLSASTFQSASNLLLFATNTAGSVDSQRGTMNLYSCQIYDNGTLVRDFVPCINESGEVGLYDLVSKQFFGNAGTGTFIGGGYTSLKTGDILNYAYTGAVQSVTLPKGVYKLEVWGAQGGYRSSSTYGGKGGYSVGTITLINKTNIFIYVGGAGNIGGTSGGFNGGGARHTYNGGGGASDIRINQDSLYARVIVAGGGGSDGATNKKGMYGGGTAGGSTSERYGTGGYGGTQTGVSSSSWQTTAHSTSTTTQAGAYAGFGFGGNGIYISNGYGGAGGGGWYGGSGSCPDSSGDDDRGGGGGSGFVWTGSNAPSGYLLGSEYYLTDASTIAGNASMPSTSGGTETGHTGNGYARITAIKVDSLNLPVNIGGTWKDANEAFVNIGGTWKTVEAAFVNIGGTWKELS